MIKSKEFDMSEYVPVGPTCSKCGYAIFDHIFRDDMNMTLTCCSKCGAVLVYRDNLLLAKLDELIKALPALKH